jgi:hypothetical protein
MSRRYLQTQTECLFRTLYAIRQPAVQREVKDTAERQLKAYAVMGASCAIRLRAIDALKRAGMMAPAIYGGPSDAA